MKTTVDIADPLLRKAKRIAAQNHTTLKDVLETALRRFIESTPRGRVRAKLETHTFGGEGLQEGLHWNDWELVRSRAYEGRGG